MKNIFLIDADETLLDFRRGEREQLEKTLQTFGYVLTEEQFTSFHEINDALWKQLEQGKTTRAFLVVERFRLLFERYKIQADPQKASALYYDAMKKSCYLLSGAEKFLQTLKERGRIYIVTNGSKVVQDSRLKGSGILSYADGVFISEDVGVDKPNKAYADYVEAHIPDYERKRAVWLGDSLTSDKLCAEAQGIDFVLFRSERPAHYSGELAATYDEALRIFQTL